MAMSSLQCDTGLRLFSDDNTTLNIFANFESFRVSYQPYHGYICLNICILGVVTNIINILVLTQRRMRSSVNIILCAIAICDTGTMLSYLIYILHFILLSTDCDPATYSRSWLIWLLFHILWSVGLHTSSLWLSVALAFLRTRTLRQAHMGSKWLRAEKTWKICLGVYCLVFALCLPNIFGQNVVDMTPLVALNNRSDCSEFLQQGAQYYTIGVPDCTIYRINLWVNGTVFKTIPCALLAYYSFALLFIIRKAKMRKKHLMGLKISASSAANTNCAATVTTTAGHTTTTTTTKERRKSSSGDSRRHIGYLLKKASTVTTSNILPAGYAPRFQRQPLQKVRIDRTTPMLLVILFIFLITELPQGAIAVLSGVYLRDVQQHIYNNFGDLLDLLSLINSSVNFFLYCAMSAKYRETFWQWVLPRVVYRRVRSTAPVGAAGGGLFSEPAGGPTTVAVGAAADKDVLSSSDRGDNFYHSTATDNKEKRNSLLLTAASSSSSSFNNQENNLDRLLGLRSNSSRLSTILDE